MTPEIKKTVEIKRNGKYILKYTDTDELEVYRDLTECLIAKKINQCKWIKSIQRKPNYDGTQTIVIYHSNDVRATYIIEQ